MTALRRLEITIGDMVGLIRVIRAARKASQLLGKLDPSYEYLAHAELDAALELVEMPELLEVTK